jgi:hypothetical protein
MRRTTILKKRNNNSTRRSRAAQSRSTRKSQPLTLRQQDERIRCLAAINRYRRGEADSLSAAARAERTTVDAIRALLPEAITQDEPGGRIEVKPSDRYSAKVQILTNEGALSVTARGSRERELAGRHRATVLRVLRGQEPPSTLEQYRGKTVGGHELVSDFELLSALAQADAVGQLGPLYVSPDASV